MDKTTLKDKLRPLVQKAGMNARLFADYALPVAKEFFDDSVDFDQLADDWNCVVVELLEEFNLVKSKRTALQ